MFDLDEDHFLGDIFFIGQNKAMHAVRADSGCQTGKTSATLGFPTLVKWFIHRNFFKHKGAQDEHLIFIDFLCAICLGGVRVYVNFDPHGAINEA